MNGNNLTKKVIEFKDLPDAVKSWLSSTTITNLIASIDRGLKLATAEKIRVIPSLILNLCLGKLPPENLVKELTEKLDLDPAASQSLAKEIEEKTLRPIETPLLKQMGIDLKMIYKPLQRPIPTPPPLIATQEAAHPPTGLAPAGSEQVPSKSLRPESETRLKGTAEPTPVSSAVKIPINVTSPKRPLPPIPPTLNPKQ